MRYLSPGVSAPTYWCDSQVTCTLIGRKPDTLHHGCFMVSLGSWVCLACYRNGPSCVIQTMENIFKTQSVRTSQLRHPCWAQHTDQSIQGDWTLQDPAQSPGLGRLWTWQRSLCPVALSMREWEVCVSSRLKVSSSFPSGSATLPFCLHWRSHKDVWRRLVSDLGGLHLTLLFRILLSELEKPTSVTSNRGFLSLWISSIFPQHSSLGLHRHYLEFWKNAISFCMGNKMLNLVTEWSRFRACPHHSADSM